MGNYLIRHKEGGYLRKGENAQWIRTQEIEFAERVSKDKAMNILGNCISPNFRKQWELVPEDEIYDTEEEEKTMEFDWKVISEAQHRLYLDLTKYGHELRNQLSEVDLEICDIQHYMEFFTLDAARGYKAYRMLKERLERRRYIKDEMLKVNCFINGNSDDFSSGRIDRQIKGVDSRKYTPRVLNELFGLNGEASSGFRAS